MYRFRYSKLKLFAIKLKKKLNETTSLLQKTEQDKAKLEKIVSESASTETKGSEAITDGEGDVKASAAEVVELQEKVKALSVITEDYENVTQELESLKGMLNFG